jgi:hypothetical protein
MTVKRLSPDWYDWYDKFGKYRGMPVEIQRQYKFQIVPLFRKFWRSKPTEEEFARCLDGILICPEFFYIMVKRQVKERG